MDTSDCMMTVVQIAVRVIALLVVVSVLAPDRVVVGLAVVTDPCEMVEASAAAIDPRMMVIAVSVETTR
jgi:hypothetical protein